MAAYYNEIDPFAAQTLRNLIAAGHIAPGDVDERSIEDVRPDDLQPYTQCHFFAGVGVWSAALRAAGCRDDMRVWTGSCPCQPFSAAGKGAGFADERHLWPAWYWLIDERRPAIIFGEQVASKAVEPWIDLVQADVEALDYAFGCVPFPSAGVGAPHIRDRAYWMAYANRSTRGQGRAFNGGRHSRSDAQSRAGFGGGVLGALADDDDDDDGCKTRREVRPVRKEHDPEHGGGASRLDHSERERFDAVRIGHNGRNDGQFARAASEGSAGPRPTNGFWRSADWLVCRDGKWRPVEPGAFPLAHGAPARVGRLRAYGNAINLEAARAFIEAGREAIGLDLL